MFFSDRRESLLHLSLVGMEVTWFTPYVLLLSESPGRLGSPATVFAGLLLALMSWLVALELLNRVFPESPGFEIVVAVAILVSSLLLVRVWLYWGVAVTDFDWLRQSLLAVLNFQHGLRAELALLLVSLFLWQRAATATSRELSFFRVGLSFRSGILFLVIGATWLSLRGGQNLVNLLWIYFSFGLLAVAISRLNDKALDASGSSGPLLPPGRLVLLGLVIAATLGSAGLLSLFYTPTRIRWLLGYSAPLWQILGVLFVLFIQLIFFLLEPILVWLQRAITALAERIDWRFFDQITDIFGAGEGDEQVEQGQSLIETLPPWVWTSLRYTVVVVVLLLVVAFILLYLDKLRPSSKQTEAEKVFAEDIILGGGFWQDSLRRLKMLARLARRFGVSRGLLAAISVENLYANLCRLARQRGYPRRPAQPPDDYLALLVRAFGGHEAHLSRLTAAYMRVHYGEQPVSRSELARLRADYQRVRTAPTNDGEEGYPKNRD